MFNLNTNSGGGVGFSGLTINTMNYKDLNNIISEEIEEINNELEIINKKLKKINIDLKSSSFIKKQELIKLKKEKLILEKEREKLEKKKEDKEIEKKEILNNELKDLKIQQEKEKRQEYELKKQKDKKKNEEEKEKRQQYELKKQEEREKKRKEREEREERRKKSIETEQRRKKEKKEEKEKEKIRLQKEEEERRQQEREEGLKMGEENTRSKFFQTERMEENREEIKEILISKENNNILCEELKKTLSSFSLENIPNIQKQGHYFIDNEGKKIIKNINNNEIKKNPYFYANKHGYTFKKTLLTNINKTNEINELNGVLCKLFIIIGFINNYELKDDKFMILLKGKRAIQYLLKNKIYNIKTTDIDILIKYKNEEYQYDELEIYEKTIYIGNLITELLNNNKIRFSMDSLSGIENINNKKEFIKEKRKEWNELNNKRRTFNPYIFKILYNGSPIMDIDMRDIKHETKNHFENIKKDYIQLKLSNGKIIDLLYYTQKFDQLLNETNYYLRSSDLTNYNRKKLTKKNKQMKNIKNKGLL